METLKIIVGAQYAVLLHISCASNQQFNTCSVSQRMHLPLCFLPLTINYDPSISRYPKIFDPSRPSSGRSYVPSNVLDGSRLSKDPFA